MDNLQMWQLVLDAWAALRRHYEPVIAESAKALNFDMRTWGLLLAVLTFEPEDTTPAHLMIRGPYTSADMYRRRLEAAAQAGFLQEIAPGRFRLSELGRDSALKLIEIGRQAMSEADPLIPQDGARLRDLLDRLVRACLETPPPPQTWSIQLSCRLMPPIDPPMPFIEQAISALWAYRDDAHLAAWQHSGLSATALETLTLLWRGEVDSLETLCKRLEARGHSCQVYQAGIHDLRKRGYVNGPDHAPWLTGSGRVFRNQVEDETNRLFFRPWSCLSQDNRQEMIVLLERMREGLTSESG